ncbi:MULTISPECIES: AAA family ATPase [Methylomicrobium]|uniref:Uncharacterized protein n=1 Tax=Methylomicrobium album BG8 TaxID=686340 RepID=H8GLQ2_METAL|nr:MULTISPECIES: AAA family ATPase [Methylomicrobium]EIC30579.1 hypothetical protein Metal_2893 [Methylomicrobium album BG8]
MNYEVIEPGRMAVDVPNLPSVTRKRPIEPVSLETLLAHTFPTRELILAPVFTLGSLNMIFARRGIGKTHASLGIAYAAASGGSLWGWTAARPYKVLLIDGEMPGESLQARLAAIVAASNTAPDPEFLQIITIDLQGGIMPDLSTVEGQDAIDSACQAAELVIVDNLSCLCRSGRENEAESWVTLSEWALRMRSAGKCVIFVHHAGKDGQQRGTSKREDILDVVVELKRPADYNPEQGARFIVNFTKARHLAGSDAQPFEAWLQADESGRQAWTTKTATESTFEQVVELANLGLSQGDIAVELGINKSSVCRHIQKAKGDGLIVERPKKPANSTRARRADIDD